MNTHNLYKNCQAFKVSNLLVLVIFIRPNLKGFLFKE
jgi:hypothetical protein